MRVVESLEFEPTVFFFDRVNPATVAMAEHFKERKTMVYFEPSSMKGNWTQFEKCVVGSDIVKFSNQRLPDVSFADKYRDKLFIQTLGSKGLQFNLFGNGWVVIPAIPNLDVVDTSGAGDWTTATLLDEMVNADIIELKDLTVTMVKELLEKAQVKGAESCSYEGARGMMEKIR